jgi:hypothetical protein
MTKAKAKAKAKRMPGIERPAASRLVIQRPLPTKPHHRNTGKDNETLCRPARRHRSWITPQGATPTERLHHNTHNFNHSKHALQIHIVEA